MARVTVEDCVQRVPNRFELVMLASQRSREISAGAEPKLERDNDKNPVVALREIADEKVLPNDLHTSLVQSLQRHVEVDEPEEDGFDAMAANPEFAQIASQVTEQSVADAGMQIDEDDEEEAPGGARSGAQYEDVDDDKGQG